ncbi:MAG: AMP-binding protein [Gammaproteobacteria bacterium]|nr:AMP-binding protein [Gammaproteobacteria bacterium]NNC98516.1 AMP-binding protein [Gammaproteobacteria bacterium]NNM13497.1 AMP-binding protein [Gammaproteobacteria bacterium]
MPAALECTTLNELIDQACKNYANNDAFTCLGKTLSFADIDRLSAQFASYLQNHTNLKPGDRVAVQLPNLLQFPVVVFGILRAGMIVVNTNPLYTDREVEHQLNDSGAKVMVVLANIANTAASVMNDTTVEQVIVTEIGDLHGTLKGNLMNLVVKKVKKMVPDFHFDNAVKFKQTLKLGSEKPPQDANVSPDDIAVLQYTGGTTGVAKGAMLSHGNLTANFKQVYALTEGTLGEGTEIFAAPLPLYHVYAFTTHCSMVFGLGNHSVLIPNPRDFDSVVDALKPHKFTGFIGLNTLYNGLLHHEGFRSLDFSNLKVSNAGGMAMTPDVSKLWSDLTGVEIAEGYGLTETSPVASANPLNDIRIGTVGKAIKDTEIVLMDPDHNIVPQGERGEIAIRGPQVMKGYWQRPEATEEVITPDGFFLTGDIGIIDADGYIRIVDRIKDMILVSGFNVYPNEIEQVVSNMDKVLESAAIGVPHPKSGEAVKLFVVKADDSLTAEEVIAYCRENMTGYKVPKFVEFREELPKSNVGKILRRMLKEEEQATRELTV